MIIISQKRDMIINFDNVVSINVSEKFRSPSDILPGWIVGVEKDNIQTFRIGEYKTEERAKEVLEGIIKFYTRLDLEKQELPVDEAIAITMLRDRAAFWMPLE